MKYFENSIFAFLSRRLPRNEKERKNEDMTYTHDFLGLTHIKRNFKGMLIMDPHCTRDVTIHTLQITRGILNSWDHLFNDIDILKVLVL